MIQDRIEKEQEQLVLLAAVSGEKSLKKLPPGLTVPADQVLVELSSDCVDN